MALTNGELVTAIVAERAKRASAPVFDNISWQIRRALWVACNDASLRLAKAAGTFSYGEQGQATADFAAGALRAAISAAANPDTADLARLARAGIAVNETSLTSAELALAMDQERFRWGGVDNNLKPTGWKDRYANTNDHASWPFRRPLLECANDAARRMDAAAGYVPFIPPNRTIEAFAWAALRLATLATDSPTAADTARLDQANLV